MFAIKKIHARQIIDSRGNPTVECDVILENGVIGRAAVPSGASTGSFEAHELRDGLSPEALAKGDGNAYMGRGVLTAVKNVNKVIAKALIGMDVTAQSAIDNKMIKLDGTPNKSHLGANAILAVSLAAAHAVADAKEMPLYKYIAEIFGNKNPDLSPRPMMNIINGGAHADNGLDIQEFMIIPNGADNINAAIQMGAEVFHNLKSILKRGGNSTNVGDEGGFAPNFDDTKTALDTIMAAISAAGYKPGADISIGLDVASSEFFENGIYEFQGEKRTAEQMIEFFADLIEQYPIISIEDGLAEDDWAGWANLTARLGNKCQLVGDDLFVTNPKRLEKGGFHA